MLKIKFYKENNKNLIELTDKDIENLDDIMPVRLRLFLLSQFNLWLKKKKLFNFFFFK